MDAHVPQCAALGGLITRLDNVFSAVIALGSGLDQKQKGSVSCLFCFLCAVGNSSASESLAQPIEFLNQLV